MQDTIHHHKNTLSEKFLQLLPVPARSASILFHPEDWHILSQNCYRSAPELQPDTSSHYPHPPSWIMTAYQQAWCPALSSSSLHSVLEIPHEKLLFRSPENGYYRSQFHYSNHPNRKLYPAYMELTYRYCRVKCGFRLQWPHHIPHFSDRNCHLIPVLWLPRDLLTSPDDKHRYSFFRLYSSDFPLPH